MIKIFKKWSISKGLKCVLSYCKDTLVHKPCKVLHDKNVLFNVGQFNTRKISLYKVSPTCHSYDVTKFIFQNSAEC